MATSLKPIWTLSFLLMLFVGCSKAGVLDYNMMSCMDFARHMGSTVPNRFGVLGGEGVAAAADVIAKRQSVASVVPSSVSNLFSSVTNLGDQNVANCKSLARHGFCESIDGVLEQNFPEWFFQYQVTNNMNHVANQLTTHRYLSLFEATIKAYKCLCQC